MAENEVVSGLQELMIQAIGMGTVAWAILEWRLDNLIDTLHDNGGERVQTNLPVSLDNKLSYLKGSVKHRVVPASFADEITDLRAKIQSLKIKRHDTVHGILIQGPDGRTFTANRSWVKKGERISAQTNYSIADVHKLTSDATSLGIHIDGLHDKIRSDLGLENFKYPGD